MQIYARMVDGFVVDVSGNPAEEFHPDIAAEFVAVPEGVSRGWQLIEDEWTPPPEPAEPELPAPTYRTLVSPVEFKMLFSPAERLAIRQAREYAGEDEALKTLSLLVDDWWSIVDDPRLTGVDLSLPQTQAGLDMLVPAGILTAGRRAEIGLGIPQ